jgi:hypothetical protein
MTERSAQKRARRHRARAAGKCGQCTTKPAFNGLFRCETCLESVRRKHAERRTRGDVPWLLCCLIAGTKHRADCRERSAA